jgi:DNA-directed RNA polymerase subunit RPC12/RpoP
MVFTYQCSQCGKVLWFASNLAGKLTICPACGAVMRLTPPRVPPQTPAASPPEASAAPPDALAGAAEETAIPPEADAPAAAPPPVSPFEQIQPPPPEGVEQAPEAVEQAYLTHQAAAAAGEVHVEMDESDLVQWTAQQDSPQQPPAPPPATPPVWSPTPLSELMLPAQSASRELVWIRSPPGSRIDSLMRRSPSLTIEQGEIRRRTIIWGIGATLVVAMIIGVLWLLRGEPAAATWEQVHRDEILALKDTADQYVIAGDDRLAYNKYQELEHLVSGQTITDPFLQQELARSWLRRDALFERLTAAHRASANPNVAQAPATAPSTAPSPETDTSTTTEPSQSVWLLPPPTTGQPPIPAPPVAPKRVVNRHPPIRPDIPPASGPTDAQIGAAISGGVDYLLGRFTGPELSGDYEHYEGLDTLAVYALMQAELARRDKRLDIHNPFMISAIDAMKKFPMSGGYVTYARALRATALALNDRPQDHAMIRQDVEWLLNSQEGGAFTYNNEFPRGSQFSFWDNSNSQYGLLGVWSGAEVGIQVPSEFWRDVREHWTKYQLADGEWCYRGDQTDPSRSMTLAGIASLFVAQDYLDGQEFADQVGRPPFSPALAKALKWLESGDNSVIALPASADFYTYYALYGLERTGLASGFKYYGSNDWYRQGAADIMAAQNADGSWGKSGEPFDTVVDTSFALLFLARGRHPILMNKLRYDGDWANRPRDVANLARFASAELERPLNWQVVPLDHDWLDWTDSPILYMAGDTPPTLSDDDKEKIKRYVENGGMLLTQADGGEERFSRFVQKLGKELFPQYSWIDLPADHVLFSVSYRLSGQPKIRAITNGSRILMMHWPTDVTKYWQLRQDRAARSVFELGVNLSLYAAGKSELKNRLESDYVAMPSDEPAGSIALARIGYNGNWDPEPAAWPRARRWFRQQTSLDFNPQPIAMENLGDCKAPIAHLIGTKKLNLDEAQIQSVKKYVQGGGVLVIEPCGMPDEFLQSVHDDLLLRMFPAARIEPVGQSNPLVTASGNGMTDVSHPEVRQFVRSYTDVTDWRPTMVKAGQGRIIILPLDMTSGLLGTDAWGIAGYQSDYALQLMKNIVLWAWDGAPDAT